MPDNGEQLLVSIVVPVYNEEACVEKAHAAIDDVFGHISGCGYEILFVDDGSRDATAAIVESLPRLQGNVKLVQLSRNFGKERSITAGLDYAQGDAVILMDADLQDPPEVIAGMIDKWSRGAQVVIGRRIDRSSDGYLKRNSAALFYKAHNLISFLEIPENVGDFRLMDRAVVEALQKLPETERFMKGLYAWVGFDTEVIEYIRPERVDGDTKFSPWKLWNLALEGFTSFSTAPLRVWVYIGLFGAFATGLYALFLLMRTMTLGISVPGYASTLITILFLGSIQLISTGIIGEYLGRVYMESKGRPNYVVKRFVDLDNQQEPGNLHLRQNIKIDRPEK